MDVLKNNVFIELTCPHCQSELRVFEEDINVYHGDCHGTTIDIYCAACKQRIDLESKQLRPEWKHLLVDPNDDD